MTPDPFFRSRSRKTFTVLAGLSFLIAVLTALLWVRSYSRGEVISCLGGMGFEIMSSDGVLWVELSTGWPEVTGLKWRSGNDLLRNTLPSTYSYVNAGGTRYADWIVAAGTGRTEMMGPSAGSAMRVHHTLWLKTPHWVALVAAISLPAIWVVYYLHQQRIRRTFVTDALLICPQCGYDLRGSPTMCPECGYVIPGERR